MHAEDTQTPDHLIEARSREQLSALIDGALAPVEARFLQRRLQHDAALRDCWSRWQGYGEVLRGQSSALGDPQFSQRVMAALAAEPQIAVAASHAQQMAMPPRGRWMRRIGGAALAASVALVALFSTRQSLPDPAATPSPQVASMQQSPDAALARTTTPVESMPSMAVAASAVAVADAQRRSDRSVRRQQQRAAYRNNIARAAEPPAVAAAVSAPAPVAAHEPVTVAANASNATPASPFGKAGEQLQARPWPRAVLPNAGSAGLNVRYGESSAGNYYPFEPRIDANATHHDGN